jgi:hypothetical protein
MHAACLGVPAAGTEGAECAGGSEEGCNMLGEPLARYCSERYCSADPGSGSPCSLCRFWGTVKRVVRNGFTMDCVWLSSWLYRLPGADGSSAAAASSSSTSMETLPSQKPCSGRSKHQQQEVHWLRSVHNGGRSACNTQGCILHCSGSSHSP